MGQDANTQAAQIGGITLGLAIASAVFVNGAQNDLQGLLPHASRADIQQTISGTSSAFLYSLTPSIKEKALVLVVNNLRKA